VILLSEKNFKKYVLRDFIFPPSEKRTRCIIEIYVSRVSTIRT